MVLFDPSPNYIGFRMNGGMHSLISCMTSCWWSHDALPSPYFLFDSFSALSWKLGFHSSAFLMLIWKFVQKFSVVSPLVNVLNLLFYYIRNYSKSLYVIFIFPLICLSTNEGLEVSLSFLSHYYETPVVWELERKVKEKGNQKTISAIYHTAF